MPGASLSIIIRAQDNASRDLKNLEKNLDHLGRTTSDLGRKMSLASALITAPLLAAAGGATKLAMDAVESENLFEVSMGQMANSARKWSEDLRGSLGLNAVEVRKNAGTFDVMLKSMGMTEQAAFGMSKGMTQLAYDMASFYNLSNTDAFDKLKSGISGETEPLKALGIVINDTAVKNYALGKGFITQGQELSEAGKVAARYNLILERTSAAQGDLARTADSPANQLRRVQNEFKALATEVGQEFLPVVSESLTWINNTGLPAVRRGADLLKRSWIEMGDETKTQFFVIGGLMVAGGPLLKGISVGIAGVQLLTKAFMVLRLGALVEVAAVVAGLDTLHFFGVNTLRQMADWSLNFINLMRLTEVPGTIGETWRDWAHNIELARDKMADFTNQGNLFAHLADPSKSMTAFGIKSLMDAAGSLSDIAFDALGQKLGSLGGDFGKQFGWLLRKNAVTEIDTIKAEIEMLKTQAAKPIKTVPGGWAAPPSGAAPAAKQIDELKSSLDAAGISQQQFVGYLVSQTPAALTAASAVDTLKLRITGLKDQQEGLRESTRAAQDALRGMQERVSDLSNRLSVAKQRLQELTSPQLFGMGAMDEGIFQAEQAIKRLNLAKLLGGAPGDVETQIAAQQKLLDTMRLRREVTYDPQLRQLRLAAAGTTKELTLAEALSGIQSTKAEISSLTGELAGAEGAVRAQEAAIRAMEQASAALDNQMKLLEADLTTQEIKQNLVNEALTTAYTWLLEDRRRIEELGPAAVASATLVDEKTRLLLESTTKYAQEESKAAIKAIQDALDAFNRAKAEMAGGLTPRAGVMIAAPGTASGGIVTSPQIRLIGEAGPEAIVPLGRGGYGGIDYERLAAAAARRPIYVQLDAQTIARIITTEQGYIRSIG